MIDSYNYAIQIYTDNTCKELYQFNISQKSHEINLQVYFLETKKKNV